ncbi:uncharacterized protein LOC143376182 [Andrena cerasifolii]|uniref:uncharacterized protein LOC143376182 n=1 Tax=Andrena cerasifolii TaxID=2819439 RepID=UPI004037BC30
MLCNSEAKERFKASEILYSILILLYISVQLSVPLSVPMDYSTTTMLTNNATNDSLDDSLYVIKAVVYEIGILTDANSTADNTTERQEEVKISFYNPPNTSNRP